MTKKITLEIVLQDWELNILLEYGYDIIKNVEQQLKDAAYWISVEENNDEEDIGTETVNEMRKQNGEF